MTQLELTSTDRFWYENDLASFYRTYGLEFGPWLRVLRETSSLATGVAVVRFMSGEWSPVWQAGDGERMLEVLCHGRQAVQALCAFLELAGYCLKDRCRHNVGEWQCVPRDKRCCLVRGRWGACVVHLVELPRSSVETVVSRAYGSMVGTYTTGGGVVVSLFPHLTLTERKVWVPALLHGRVMAPVLRQRYRSWTLLEPGEDGGPTVGSDRTVMDPFSRRLCFDPERGSYQGVSMERG